MDASFNPKQDWDGIVFAPHLEFPIRNGADYLIWKRWNELSRNRAKVLFLAQAGVFVQENGRAKCLKQIRASARGKYTASLRTALRGSHYFFEKYLTDAYMCEAKKIAESSSFSFVVYSFPATAAAFKMIEWRSPPKTQFVETHNFEPDLYGNAHKQASWIRKLPLWISKTNCESWIRTLPQELQFIHLTQADRDSHERLRPGHRGIVSPIGIDLEGSSCKPEDSSPLITEPYVIFSGSLGADQNVRAVAHLVEHYLTTLRNAVPSVNIVVAGSRPSPRVRDICLDNKIKLFPDPTDEEMRKLQHFALFSMCPFPESAGIKVKLLESLAANVPVLASRCVLFDARLDMPPNVFSDEPSDWSEALRVRLISPEKYAVNSLALPFEWEKVNEPILASLVQKRVPGI